MARNQITDPQHFINRHFSWMQFNERVLEEARDENNPLLERVKFLAITASNLDEFVEVRVAGMLQQVEHGNRELGPDGRIPAEVLEELAARIHAFVKSQYDCWREELLPALAAESIRVVGLKGLGPTALEYIEDFYVKAVEPLLTPVTVDPAHPFPHVLNKALCLAFLLRRKRRGTQTLSWSGDGAARFAAAGAAARKRRRRRVRLSVRRDSDVCGPPVSRLRSAFRSCFSRDAQQQSVSGRRRIAQHHGYGRRATAPPAQGRGGAAGNRGQREPGNH